MPHPPRRHLLDGFLGGVLLGLFWGVLATIDLLDDA